MNVQEYLKRPYSRLVIREDDGSYRAEIVEFPGCIALADTGPEALQQLEDVAESWLQAAISNGQPIPEPIESTEYSGRFVVRISKSLHSKATYVAKREGVSLNQFIVTCIAEHVGGAQNVPRVQTMVVGASSSGSFPNPWHGFELTAHHGVAYSTGNVFPSDEDIVQLTYKRNFPVSR